jgi:hypothetical protein
LEQLEGLEVFNQVACRESEEDSGGNSSKRRFVSVPQCGEGTAAGAGGETWVCRQTGWLAELSSWLRVCRKTQDDWAVRY